MIALMLQSEGSTTPSPGLVRPQNSVSSLVINRSSPVQRFDNESNGQLIGHFCVEIFFPLNILTAETL